MNLSETSVCLGYDPIDDNSETGYRRPPKKAECVVDYFAAIAGVEDDGLFAALEMDEMLNHPERFFA